MTQSSQTPIVTPKSRRRVKFSNKYGNTVIRYSNGAEKEILTDGTTVTTFANGDIQTRNPQGKTTSYYFADSEVTRSTHPDDGSTIYQFANGQVEQHFADGRKLVQCPDGSQFWAGDEVHDDHVNDRSLLTEASGLAVEDDDKYAIFK